MCLNKNCSKMHQDFFVRSPTIIIFVEKRNLFLSFKHYSTIMIYEFRNICIKLQINVSKLTEILQQIY